MNKLRANTHITQIPTSILWNGECSSHWQPRFVRDRTRNEKKKKLLISISPIIGRIQMREFVIYVTAAPVIAISDCRKYGDGHNLPVRNAGSALAMCVKIMRVGSPHVNVFNQYKNPGAFAKSYHLSICSQLCNKHKTKKSQNEIRFGFRCHPRCCARRSSRSKRRHRLEIRKR